VTCHEADASDLLDGYVRGTLSDEQRDAFEQHFLGCASCAGEVETALEIHEVLRSAPRRRSAVPLWAAAAAALVLVALLAVWWTSRGPERSGPVADAPSRDVPAPAPTPTPSEEALLELAQVAPPAYEETVLRGGEDTLRQAMRLYREGRYGDAIRGLEAAMARNPQADHVIFFLGASYLLDGQTGPAIDALRIVAERPESPFSEEARFYLAKALIRDRRLEDAKAELEKLASSDGAWATDARDLLERLTAVEPALQN
jgi:tetratricopeptide (TPR) repeat protein